MPRMTVIAMTTACPAVPGRPARQPTYVALLLAASVGLGPWPLCSGESMEPAVITPVDEVVVTARKTEERVQDIPMSVQVISTELLEATRLTQLLDLQYSLPGLVLNNLGLNGTGFSLRGIADQGGSGLSVATQMNGVYLGSSTLAVTRMFDLARIELLKGPQGTLYGRNATGGSINIIPQPPQSDFNARIELAGGSFNTIRAGGHVNLPFASPASCPTVTASFATRWTHGDSRSRISTVCGLPGVPFRPTDCRSV